MRELVHFTADWCQPCQQMKPFMEEFVSENPDIKYTMIDIDKDEETAKKYNVMSVPTLICFVDNVMFNRIIGGMNKQEIENLFSGWESFSQTSDEKYSLEEEKNNFINL